MEGARLGRCFVKWWGFQTHSEVVQLVLEVKQRDITGYHFHKLLILLTIFRRNEINFGAEWSNSNTCGCSYSPFIVSVWSQVFQCQVSVECNVVICSI